MLAQSGLNAINASIFPTDDFNSTHFSNSLDGADIGARSQNSSHDSVFFNESSNSQDVSHCTPTKSPSAFNNEDTSRSLYNTPQYKPLSYSVLCYENPRNLQTPNTFSRSSSFSIDSLLDNSSQTTSTDITSRFLLRPTLTTTALTTNVNFENSFFYASSQSVPQVDSTKESSTLEKHYHFEDLREFLS